MQRLNENYGVGLRMKDEIKNIIDNKIASLFGRKVNPNNYDLAFTKFQNELRHVLHTATRYLWQTQKK